MKPILQRFAAAVGAMLDKVPMTRRGVVSLRAEPQNATAGATTATILAAIRAAEGGDTRLLFALYRDLTVAGSHVQAELFKRIMAVLGQPLAILPEDKENKDDVRAADACRQMSADCENWTDGLVHLQSATLWPVAVVEKIFRQAHEVREGAIPLRYTLRRFEIVNPTLLCFRQDFTNGKSLTPALSRPTGEGVNAAPDIWEKDLRFFKTDDDGRVDYSAQTAYYAQPIRHIIHRGHMLVGVRDNWGGPMRAIVFWWLLTQLARDWFARHFGIQPAPHG